jgi:predicted phosphodiesterase
MRLGVVSDIHWPADPASPAAWHNPYDFGSLPARLDAAGATFADAEVDAVVAGGDVSDAGDAQSARAVLERLSALGVPVLVVAGNHDGHEGEDRLEHCVAGSAAMLPARGRAIAGVATAGVEIERDAATRAFRWTGAALPAADAPVRVVASHFPVLSRAERLTELGLAYAGDLANRRALQEQLDVDAPVVVLSGHIHARESHACGALLQLSAGALVEPPHDVAIVDVGIERGEVLVRRRAHALGPPGPWRDPVLAPVDEAWRYRHGAWRRAAGGP